MSCFFLMHERKIYIGANYHNMAGSSLAVNIGSLYTTKGFYIPIGGDANLILMKIKDPSLKIDHDVIPLLRAVKIRPDVVSFILMIQNKETKESAILEEDIYAPRYGYESLIYRCVDVSTSEVLGTLLNFNKQRIQEKSINIIDILKQLKELTHHEINYVYELDLFEVIEPFLDKEVSIEDNLALGCPSIDYKVHDLTRPKNKRITQIVVETVKRVTKKKTSSRKK